LGQGFISILAGKIGTPRRWKKGADNADGRAGPGLGNLCRRIGFEAGFWRAILGLHFVYLFTPILKAGAYRSGALGEGKGKESAAGELFLQGFQLDLSRGKHPTEGQKEQGVIRFLPLPKSGKSGCSQPASEVGKHIPAARIYFVEADKDPQNFHFLF